MAKVINVFYNAQGLPFKDKELTTHFPIVGGAFQGADNTTEIRFYVDNLGANRQWAVFGKLPNGKKGFKILTESALDEDEDRYYPFMLSQFFTQYKGDLYLSLGGYYGNIVELNEEQEYELQQVSGEMTGAIKLQVAYSVQMEGSDYDELPQWLQALASKLDTNKGIVVIPNPNAIITGYQDGQLFYSKSNNKLYTLENNALQIFNDPLGNSVGFIDLNFVLTGSNLPYTLTASEIIEFNKELCFIQDSNNTLYVKKGIYNTQGVAFRRFENDISFNYNETNFAIAKGVVLINPNTYVIEYAYYGTNYVYDVGQANRRYAKLGENNIFTGLNTFASHLPQSEQLASNPYDLITLAKALLLQNESKGYVDEKIAELQAKSDVIDVLGNIAELEAYDTEEVNENDIINVLSDSEHENASTFYKLKEAQEGDIYVEPTTPDSRGYVWVYIGEEGPFLTPNEADSKYQTKIIGYPLLNIAISDWVQEQDTGKWYYNKVVSASDLTIGANDKYMLGGNDKTSSNELAECEINIDNIVTSGANTTITLVGDFVPTIPLNVSIVIAKVSPTTYGGVTFITTSDIDTDYLAIENGKLTVSADIKALLVYAKGQGWIN